jgi:ferredoxin-NADP reductase
MSWQFESQVSEVIQQTHDIKSFRFPVSTGGVRFEAGQFFFITIKINGADAIHHFSFSNSPTDEGYIEFTKRITPSEFSQALDAMKPGAPVVLRGPEGTFTLSLTQRRLAFLSGGIGITPLRSMLRFIVARNLPYDVVLLYGNNTVDDIAFRTELDGMAASHPNLRVEHVLSSPNVPSDWKGKKGFITKDIIMELVPDYAERFFYISGPPKMVIALEEQLGTVGLPPKQIKRDSFTGYD